jgi:formate-dependent nitrite reductase cytochrome c552 subunit
VRWAVLLVVLLAGCAAQRPQSAEALRQAITSSKAQTFEVRRRHRDVAATLHRQARRCLDARAYKPTMVASARKAELHVHRQAAGEGYYVLVADAWPLRRDRTTVQLYASNGYDALSAAIKAWASGKNEPCPDMSKTP